MTRVRWARLRVERTRRVIDRVDVAIIVAAEGSWSDFEEQLWETFSAARTPVIAVFNKADLARPSAALREKLAARRILVVETVASRGEGILDLREALIQSTPKDLLDSPPLVGDLVPPESWSCSWCRSIWKRPRAG